MRLIYFDETKFSESDPFFFIGGILLPKKDITNLENTLMQIQYNFFLQINWIIQRNFTVAIYFMEKALIAKGLYRKG